MRSIANSLGRVASYSFGPTTLAAAVAVALAVGFGVGFWVGEMVGTKRIVIIVQHDVGAQEVSARDRFLACSVAQPEPNMDELVAQWRKLHPVELLRADEPDWAAP
jgi:hypothetical protein